MGYGEQATTEKQHALLWEGSAASYVDLHPSGYYHSWGKDISDGRQVGYGRPTSDSYVGSGSQYYHALLWQGTAESVVNLHPTGYGRSSAVAISGSQQVGSGEPLGGGVHALLWEGAAESFVDLHTPLTGYSVAYDVSDGRQVGLGYGSGLRRALLWEGTADSVVDITPEWLDMAWPNSISGSFIAGYGKGFVDPNSHAILWHGPDNVAVDLHTFLPSEFPCSWAQGVDSEGNVVGRTCDPSSGAMCAVLWRPIPEPAALTLLALGSLLLPRRNWR